MEEERVIVQGDEGDEDIWIDPQAAADFGRIRDDFGWGAAGVFAQPPVPMDIDDDDDEERMLDHMEREMQRIADARGIDIMELDGAFERNIVTGEYQWVDFSGPYAYSHHFAKA